MNFEQLKQQYVDALLHTKAFLIKSLEEEPFTLRSGKKSYMFLDHSRLAADPEAFRSFVNVMAAQIGDTFGTEPIVLCNVDSKISAQLVGSVAYNLKLPQIIYKSKQLTDVEKGTAKQMTGDETWAMPAVILDDVMTGGDGTAKGVGDLIKETFPKIPNIHIFVGFTRDIARSTYPSHHILTRNELINIVWDSLSAGQRTAVQKETNAKP